MAGIWHYQNHLTSLYDDNKTNNHTGTRTNYLWDQWNIIHVMRLNFRLKSLICNGFSVIFLPYNFSLQVFFFLVRSPPFHCFLSICQHQHVLANRWHNYYYWLIRQQHLQQQQQQRHTQIIYKSINHLTAASYYFDVTIKLQLPSVLWHHWSGVRKSILSIKRVPVIRCRYEYISGARCRYLHIGQLMPLTSFAWLKFRKILYLCGAG